MANPTSQQHPQQKLDDLVQNLREMCEPGTLSLNVAHRAGQRLRKVKAGNPSRGALSDFRNQCLDTATGDKNWPSWLVAFKDDRPMLQRLKKAMNKRNPSREL